MLQPGPWRPVAEVRKRAGNEIAAQQDGTAGLGQERGIEEEDRTADGNDMCARPALSMCSCGIEVPMALDQSPTLNRGSQHNCRLYACKATVDYLHGAKKQRSLVCTVG